MDVSEARSKGINYWTIPGHSGKDEIKRETIEQAICRVFIMKAEDLNKKGNHILGKHFYRFVLERLKTDGTIAVEGEKRQNRKYKLSDIELRTGCYFQNISNSVKVVFDQMKTDKIFKSNCDYILQKIKLNLIDF